MYIDEEELIPEYLVIDGCKYSTAELLASRSNYATYRWNHAAGKFNEQKRSNLGRPLDVHELFDKATNAAEYIMEKYGLDRDQAARAKAYAKRRLLNEEGVKLQAMRELPGDWMRKVQNAPRNEFRKP